MYDSPLYVFLICTYDIHLFLPYLLFSRNVTDSEQLHRSGPDSDSQGIEESAGKEGEADNIAGKIESLGWCYRIRRWICHATSIGGRCWNSKTIGMFIMLWS